MDLPPEDDTWESVLSQVHDALDKLDLGRGPTREALVDGVRQALEEFGLEEVPEGARVVVLDGGKDDEDADVSPSPPGLHVVRDDEAVPDQAAAHAVRVFRVGGAGAKVSLTQGSVVLAAGAEQTLYRGDSVRAYRLCCVHGEMELGVDGSWVESLAAGQTIDVEARLIRVRSQERAAGGCYTRLSAS